MIPAAALLLGLALPPFTTAPKSSPTSGAQAQLSGLAVGCHAGYDRLVVRVGSGHPGYGVRYVSRIVQDGSGAPVSLLGNRRIQVTLRNARGHTTGGTRLLPRTLTPRCPQLRQVKLAGDFEGVVTLGLGVTRRTGFRVFRLTNPARVVVDVRH